jgi:hypothetical protein
MVGCVDESYRISDVSTEVTLGTGTTTLPIGYLETMTLQDLLGEEEIEGLVQNADGTLAYSYDGEGDTIAFEGLTTDFEIPAIKSSFKVEYPEFDVNMQAVELHLFEDIYELDGLEDYPTEGTIRDGLSFPVYGYYTKVIDGDQLHMEFDVPKEVLGVRKIKFKDIEDNHVGAPMYLSVDLRGLADVNGGGTLSFDLVVEGGTLQILDANNELICDGNHYKAEYPVAEGADKVDFVIYVASLTNDTPLDGNRLDIPLQMTYDMDFVINTKSGDYDLSDLPVISLDAHFEYGDAEISIDPDVNLIDCEVVNTPISIEGLPEELVAINSVSMRQNANAELEFYVRGLEWLGDSAEDLVVDVELPDFLKFNTSSDGSYTYDAATHTLTASVADLGAGVAIGIEALDFGAEGISPDESGKMTLDFAPRVRAHFADGSSVNVSDLVREDFDVEVGVAQTTLSIESVSGRVDYSYDVAQEFALTGLEDIDIEIDGIGLKPVIAIDITHPLTMDVKLNGSVVPCVGGVEKSENVVTFDNIVIPGATYQNGSVAEADVKIILADESLREQYADAQYTFVACDLAKLLRGTLPETVKINLEVGVDSSEVVTLHVPEGDIAISYDYSVNIPLAIDDSLDIRYRDEITGLSATFEQIAGLDIKVGDVALIATITNSTPLQFGAKVVLKDVNGEMTTAQLSIADEGKILGSSDGVTAQESKLRFEIDLGPTGDVALISDIDAVAFELEATSAASDSPIPLRLDQGIGVKLLQVEITGGVTLDIESFINK